MSKRFKMLLVSLAVGVSLLAMSSQFMNEMDDQDFLVKELAELELYISHRDGHNVAVSKVDVAWHLDHMLKVVNGIYDSLEVSDHTKNTFNINPLRLLVWTSGKMARGKGKSPDYVLPPDQIETSDIYTQLQIAHRKMNQIDSLHTNANFHHFAFGRLDLENAKRFIEIHTNHHLAIIRDILKGT